MSRIWSPGSDRQTAVARRPLHLRRRRPILLPSAAKARAEVKGLAVVKPPPFQYHDPRSLEEALALLASEENAKLLAGGQSLMPMLNMRFALPDHVIDINGIEELAYIRETASGIEIGAMTRQHDLEVSELLQRRCPLMIEALHQVGHRPTRNRGTIGGSLCHLDPAAELPLVAAALGATIRVKSREGDRAIPMSEFPAFYMTPSIEPDELVTLIGFEPWPESHGHAFVEFARRHGDFAIVAAAALLEVSGDRVVTRASVTLGGVGPAPLRCESVEGALLGERGSADLFRGAAESCRSIDAMDDVHASMLYRQQLAAELTYRALGKAFDRASEGSSS